MNPAKNEAVETFTEQGNRAAAIEALGPFGERGAKHVQIAIEAIYSEGYGVQDAAVKALKTQERFFVMRALEDVVTAWEQISEAPQ